ncbi:MAG: methionyl-tRNA formyltransferase [Spirochaetia bacterium]|nr:methionyl-tRNA formyltransferase [Spirochaetia bacterium]
MSLKIGYFGSPEISAKLLDELLNQGISVEFIVSNADKARGRSKKLLPTEVSEIALKRNIPLYRFNSLKNSDAETVLIKHSCDLYFIFAYGKILPENIYQIPALGSVNLHASLLPLLRGASPIQSSLLHGFEKTGWTLQMISAELDAGEILLTNEVQIDPDETAEELKEKLLPEGINLTLELFSNFKKYYENRKKQDHQKATFCSKINKEMSVIDWSKTSLEIHNLIRAFNPSPVARTQFRGKTVKIYRSRTEDEISQETEKLLMKAPPGRSLVLSEGKKRKLYIKTGKGILEILQLQPENKKMMDASSFINGYRLENEESFGIL